MFDGREVEWTTLDALQIPALQAWRYLDDTNSAILLAFLRRLRDEVAAAYSIILDERKARKRSRLDRLNEAQTDDESVSHIVSASAYQDEMRR